MRVRATIVLLCIACVCACAQPRAPGLRTRILGGERVGAEEVLDAVRAGGITVLRPGTAEQLREAVERECERRGFPFARVDSVTLRPNEDSTEYEADVHLTEGLPLVLGGLSFEGEAALSAEALRRAGELSPGSPFSQAALLVAIDGMLAAYDEAGYPFAAIAVRDVAIREDSNAAAADVTLDVREGERFIVSEFRVAGNTRTDADVIVRETRIAAGEAYDADRVADIRGRLERLNFFSSVSDPELYLREGRGGISIRVAEGNTNLFDGIVGYQPPRADGERGTITGLVNLSFRNLFGTGRRFDARWEHASRDVTELELRYLEPWIFDFPFNVRGGYLQRSQDSAYVRRLVEGRIDYLATNTLSISLAVQSVDVIPGINTIIPDLASSVAVNGSLEVLFDTRDDIFGPRAGVLLRNSYTGGNKRTRGPAERSDYIQRIEFDASLFHELFPRHVAALALHGRELRGSALDASDLYRLGGANSLRGYREEQFSGTRIAWLGCEYRYALGRRSFAFAFFDLGYVFEPAAVLRAAEDFTTVKRGFGLGGRIETGLGILGVSYALGEGDSFTNGKIHFGLINEF